MFTKMGLQKEKLGRDSGLNAFLNELGRTKLAQETRVSFGRKHTINV